MKKTYAAFTLIELLVVIAIIAILAAILFPVFAKARDKAQQTACLSNMKQLATAVMMYTQDWDQRYPHPYYQNGAITPDLGPPCGKRNQESAYRLPSLLMPYIRNAGIWVCPSWSTTKTCRANGFPMPTCQWSYTGLMGSPYHVDAAATCARCRRVCNPNGNQALFDVYTGALPGEVPAPANTIMMVEFRIGNGAGAIRDVDSGNPAGLHAYLEAIQNDHAWQTHNDGNNFNFCDGHAKWLRWPDFGMYTLCAEDDI